MKKKGFYIFLILFFVIRQGFFIKILKKKLLMPVSFVSAGKTAPEMSSVERGYYLAADKELTQCLPRVSNKLTSPKPKDGFSSGGASVLGKSFNGFL